MASNYGQHGRNRRHRTTGTQNLSDSSKMYNVERHGRPARDRSPHRMSDSSDGEAGGQESSPGGGASNAGSSAARSSELPPFQINKPLRHLIVVKKTATPGTIQYLNVQNIGSAWDAQQPMSAHWTNGQTRMVIHKIDVYSRYGFSCGRPHLPTEGGVDPSGENVGVTPPSVGK